MEDKEVGELWQKWQLYSHETEYAKHAVLSLIRKLVEERARRYSTGLDWAGDWHDQVTSVLRDFGIDPATWEQNRED